MKINGCTGYDELEANGVEERRNDFALKWQLTAAERRTDVKFDSNNVIGWLKLWQHLAGFTERVNAHSQLIGKAAERVRALLISLCLLVTSLLHPPAFDPEIDLFTLKDVSNAPQGERNKEGEGLPEELWARMRRCILSGSDIQLEYTNRRREQDSPHVFLLYHKLYDIDSLPDWTCAELYYIAV